MITEITTEQEFNNSITNGVCIIDFYALWCKPCKNILSILIDIANTYSHINILKINVDNLFDLTKIYNVHSVPTLLFFKNGTLQKTLSTSITKQMILNTINNLLD